MGDTGIDFCEISHVKAGFIALHKTLLCLDPILLPLVDIWRTPSPVYVDITKFINNTFGIFQLKRPLMRSLTEHVDQ